MKKQHIVLNKTKRHTARSMRRPPVSTCVTLSPRLSPGLGFAAALVSVSMLGVGVTGRNLLVSGARPRENLFTLGFLFELSHVIGQLGAEHAVQAAFSAALCFYLLQQREMRELRSRQKASERQRDGLSFVHTQRRKRNSRSPNEKDINMASGGFDS